MMLRVNGTAYRVECDPLQRLLDVLRGVGLTGTKEGCGEGECGACTVLLDGVPVNSCLVPAAQAVGHEIATIESLADDGVLSAVQSALIEHGGTQCGICTPGIALCATAILARESNASRARWRELLAGNLCRCTGYQRIIDAVVAAAPGPLDGRVSV
ncbi:MAG: (2Fe-2S)-binding protein [Planctomycetota bacterium]